MGKIIESILIIIPFMCIRKFSGGFHAKHSWVCMMSSCGILFFCVYMVTYIKYSLLCNVVVICAMVSLMIFSPIDSENRRLNLSEKREYQKVTIIIVSTFAIIYYLLLFLENKMFAISIAEGIILTASLQMPCVFKKMRNNSKNNYAISSNVKKNRKESL